MIRIKFHTMMALILLLTFTDASIDSAVALVPTDRAEKERAEGYPSNALSEAEAGAQRRIDDKNEPLLNAAQDYTVEIGEDGLVKTVVFDDQITIDFQYTRSFTSESNDFDTVRINLNQTTQSSSSFPTNMASSKGVKIQVSEKKGPKKNTALMPNEALATVDIKALTINVPTLVPSMNRIRQLFKFEKGKEGPVAGIDFHALRRSLEHLEKNRDTSFKLYFNESVPYYNGILKLFNEEKNVVLDLTGTSTKNAEAEWESRRQVDLVVDNAIRGTRNASPMSEQSLQHLRELHQELNTLHLMPAAARLESRLQKSAKNFEKDLLSLLSGAHTEIWESSDSIEILIVLH